MRKRRCRRGFTLIEMIVATLLLALGIVGLLSAISTSTRASGIADSIHTATLLAQQKLSEIELQPSSLTGGDQQGDFGDAFSGFRWRETVEATSYQSLFKVTVTVTWGLPTPANQQVFTTYMRNDQNQSSQQNQNGTNSGTGNGIGNRSNSAGGLGSG